MIKPRVKISEVLKDLMTENNLSGRKLAECTGLSHNAICTWIRGDFYPDITNLKTLIRFFKKSGDYLLGLTTDPKLYICSVESDFTTRLSQCISENGSALREIARECNFEASSISKWLRGTSPGLEYVASLAAYFNCSVDYLIGIADYKS